MIRLLYNVLFPIGFILFLPAYAFKMLRRGNNLQNLGQRFAIYSAEVKERLARSPRTWIHAVSVGEVGIALKLAAKLKQLDPDFACALTTTTTTGFAFARQEACDWIEVLYNPLDFWLIIRRAFAIIRPLRIILVEAEVWPNLVAIGRAKQIPIALVNARLSRRSEQRFHQFKRFVAPTFRCLDLVCVQEPEDVDRWAQLGIPHDRIVVVGSVKFDPAEIKLSPALPLQVLRAFGIETGCPILLGGSTHAGEEEILGKIFQRLRVDFPTLTLIIAPRHVERVPEVRAQLEQMSLRTALRSEVGITTASPVECLLLDTTGELQHWYAAATIVFIGKSMTARGGQNPVEPIIAGKPVLFGPHMENFSVLAHRLVTNKAAVQVDTPNSLQHQIVRLLRDRDAASRLVANAAVVVAAHAGATARTASLVSALHSRAK